MNIEDSAFHFKTRARGYDEKSKIIQEVAQKWGRDGLTKFAKLTECSVDELRKYAVLNRYFEDKNRARRQRKPKQRPTMGKIIEPYINSEIERWKTQ